MTIADLGFGIADLGKAEVGVIRHGAESIVHSVKAEARCQIKEVRREGLRTEL